MYYNIFRCTLRETYYHLMLYEIDRHTDAWHLQQAGHHAIRYNLLEPHLPNCKEQNKCIN